MLLDFAARTAYTLRLNNVQWSRTICAPEHFHELPSPEDRAPGLDFSDRMNQEATVMVSNQSSSKQVCLSRLVTLAVIIGSLLCLPATAQVDYATATLRGTVMDPQGAVIADAAVTATNRNTGVHKTVQTGPDGRYQLSALPPGSYDISVTKQGFRKEIAKAVQLSVGQALIYDAHLKIGEATESVEVSADSVPLIQAEQSQQANTIDQRQVEELPNINRNFTYNVYTVPGVTNSEAPRAQNPGFTGFLTTGFSIGGSNGRNNLSTIDGGENEYGTGQYRVTNLPVEAIQEYQVNRNGFAAEFGFTDGSAINIVTKSGGNLWHGSLYSYFRDQHTEATNFFNGFEGFPRAFNQSLYMGGSLGGPIKKDKLFFFTAYERERLDTPFFNFLVNTPQAQGISTPGLGQNCAAQIAGGFPDQVCYLNLLKTQGDPFLQGFANAITPGMTPLNNPALNKILNRDNGVFNTPDRLHNAIVRFDYQATNRDSINMRIGYAQNDFNSAAGGITNGTPDSYTLFVRDFSILTTWSRSISPNVVNQALVQIVPRNRSNAVPLHDNGVNFSLGSLGLDAPGPGGTGTYGAPALVPYLAHQQRYQFEDNVTWTKGNHNFKFGASYRPANYTVQDNLWFNPEFDFKDGVIPIFALAPAALQTDLATFNAARYPRISARRSPSPSAYRPT
jgi:Carboxypeptidase regulatory-like domain